MSDTCDHVTGGVTVTFGANHALKKSKKGQKYHSFVLLGPSWTPLDSDRH